MTSMDLKAEDVVAILKACGEANVRSLKFKGLVVAFDEQDEIKPTTIHYTLSDTKEEKSEQPQVQEVDYESLALTDPVRWEALQLGEESMP